jgi:hypothetical protein
MCPAAEVDERINIAPNTNIHELDTSTGAPDAALLVTMFHRNDAARVWEPSDIRRISALARSVEHLIASVPDRRFVTAGGAPTPRVLEASQWMPSGEPPFYQTASFVAGRLRQVRQEMKMQEDSFSPAALLCCVDLLEQCTRFHIMVEHRNCELGIRNNKLDDVRFDGKMNMQMFTQSISGAFNLYDKLKAQHGLHCPNEAELLAYFLLSSGDPEVSFGKLQAAAQRGDVAIFKAPILQRALRAVAAIESSDVASFFRELRAADYLSACLMHKHFDRMRFHGLRAINRAFVGTIDLSLLQSMLCLEDAAEGARLAAHASLAVDEATGAVTLRRGDQLRPARDAEGAEMQLPLVCSSMIEAKRAGVPLALLLMSPSVPPVLRDSGALGGYADDAGGGVRSSLDNLSPARTPGSSRAPSVGLGGAAMPATPTPPPRLLSPASLTVPAAAAVPLAARPSAASRGLGLAFGAPPATPAPPAAAPPAASPFAAAPVAAAPAAAPAAAAAFPSITAAAASASERPSPFGGAASLFGGAPAPAAAPAPAPAPATPAAPAAAAADSAPAAAAPAPAASPFAAAAPATPSPFFSRDAPPPAARPPMPSAATAAGDGAAVPAAGSMLPPPPRQPTTKRAADGGAAAAPPSIFGGGAPAAAPTFLTGAPPAPAAAVLGGIGGAALPTPVTAARASSNEEMSSFRSEMSTTSDSGVAAPREWQAWTFALGDLETIDSSRIEAEAAAAAGCLDAVIDEVTDGHAWEIATDVVKARYAVWLVRGRKDHPPWLASLATDGPDARQIDSARRRAAALLRFRSWRLAVIASRRRRDASRAALAAQRRASLDGWGSAPADAAAAGAGGAAPVAGPGGRVWAPRGLAAGPPPHPPTPPPAAAAATPRFFSPVRNVVVTRAAAAASPARGAADDAAAAAALPAALFALPAPAAPAQPPAALGGWAAASGGRLSLSARVDHGGDEPPRAPSPPLLPPPPLPATPLPAMRGDVDGDDGAAAAAQRAGTGHQPRGPKQLDALLRALADAREAQASVDTAVDGADAAAAAAVGGGAGGAALAFGAVDGAAPPSALGELQTALANAREERRAVEARLEQLLL